MAKQRRKVKKDSGRTTITIIATLMGIVVSIVITNVLFTMITGKHLRSGEDVYAYMNNTNSKVEKLQANRGLILDRNLEVIAQDIESYELYAIIDPSRQNAGDDAAFVSDYGDVANKLAPILKTDANVLKEKLELGAKAGSYQVEFGTAGKSLTNEQKNQIDALEIGGLEFRKSTSRVYPTGVFASQLIGYTSKNEDGATVGAVGLENYYNEQLTGKDGELTYQTGSRNNILPNTERIVSAPSNGANVVTTIDSNVQQSLEKAMSDTMEKNGAEKAFAIVMEAKTGKVLAQAGYPTYDLNDSNTLENSIQHNLPSWYAFEAGSVMKPFVYAAAMNEGVYKGDDYFQSGTANIALDANGYAVRTYDGAGNLGAISDAEGKNYGSITFDEGLIRSTNTGMVTLVSQYLNQDKMVEYLQNFGFGKYVGMEGMSEEQAGFGSVNDPNVHPLTKLNNSFGQGITVTPYQVMQAASALFNDGTMVKPYIIDKVVDPTTNKVLYQGKTEVVGNPITPETSKQIQGLMGQVVSDERGTGHILEMEDVTLLAKTGTGEVADIENGGYRGDVYTSSILAAAPADDPQIIIFYGFESANYKYFSRDYFKEVVRSSLDAVKGYSSNSTSETINEELGNYEEYTMPELVNHTNTYVNQKLENFKVNKLFIGDGHSILKQFPETGSTVISNQNIFLLTDGSNITMPNMKGWSRRDISIFAELTGITVTYKGSGRLETQSIAEGTQITSESTLEVDLK